MKTEYRHIRFVKATILVHGKDVWRCINKQGEELCDVSYYPKWKKYVDDREPGMCFDSSCLRDLADFMDQLQTNKEKP